MPNLLNLIPNAVNQGHAQIVYAEVAAPAPATFHDTLYVTLPDWSSDFALPIADWPAIHGTNLPLTGDAVLLVTDSRGLTRCVWWDGLMVFGSQNAQVFYLTTAASDVASHTKATAAPLATGVVHTGTTHASITVDGLSSPGTIVVGSQVTGSGIHADTYVVSVNVGASSMVISNPAISSLVGTSLTFGPKIEIAFTAVQSGGVLDYMTDPGLPSVTFLPAGQYEFHIHARQTAGDQSVRLYAEFWEYDPTGGASIPPGNDPGHVAMIGQSQLSKSLTLEEIEYRLFFVDDEVYTFFSARSRVAVHVFAAVGGTSGANISFFVGGAADSHYVIPTIEGPVGSGAWITPSLINGWTGVSHAYLRDPLGFVHLRGSLAAGGSGTVAFVLPAGYRPGITDFYSILQSSGAAGSYLNIATNGNVTVTYVGPTAYLNTVSFLAEN